MIFEPYYQDSAKDIIWEGGILISAKDKEIEEALNEELDWIITEELENEEKSNKWFRSILEHDIVSVDSFATRDFGLTSTSSNNTQNIMMENAQKFMTVSLM